MRRLLVTCIALMGFSHSALAEGEQWEVGASAGTNGVGLELSFRMNDFLRLRGGYHFYDIGVDVDSEDNNGVQGDELKHSADLELSNLALLADWYPWGGAFRVSAGAVANQNDFSVQTACNNPTGCEVGSNSFSRTEIGTITTDIDVENFGPYLGIGWDRTLDATKRWTMSFEIGAFYQGAPNVEMTSTGSCAGSTSPLFSQCRDALEDEEDELEDELDSLKFYPVVSLGIGYRF